MRDIFIEELIRAVEINKNIILLVNDLGFGVIEKFCKKFPKNYFPIALDHHLNITFFCNHLEVFFLILTKR